MKTFLKYLWQVFSDHTFSSLLSLSLIAMLELKISHLTHGDVSHLYYWFANAFAVLAILAFINWIFNAYLLAKSDYVKDESNAD